MGYPQPPDGTQHPVYAPAYTQPAYGPYAVQPYPPVQPVQRKPFWTTAKIVSVTLGLFVTAVLCGTGAVVSIISLDHGTTQEAGADPGGDPGYEPPKAELPTIGIGQCLSKIEAATADPTAYAVSCPRPHLGEVFEVIPIAEGAYPGEAAFQDKLANCTSRLAAYAKMSRVEKMTVFVTYPTQERWEAGDHLAYCVVGSKTVTTTGTVSKTF
jgi:putative regulator of septum formation